VRPGQIRLKRRDQGGGIGGRLGRSRADAEPGLGQGGGGQDGKAKGKGQAQDRLRAAMRSVKEYRSRTIAQGRETSSCDGLLAGNPRKE
jgi:hypothetical protein